MAYSETSQINFLHLYYKMELLPVLHCIKPYQEYNDYCSFGVTCRATLYKSLWLIRKPLVLRAIKPYLESSDWLKLSQTNREIYQHIKQAITYAQVNVDKMSFNRLPQLVQTLPNLVQLSILNNNNITALPDMSCLSNVKKLELLRCRRLNNIILLGQLFQLEYLKLSWCPTLKNYWPIACLINLRTLKLTLFSRFQDLGVLSYLKKLQHLELSGCVRVDNIEPMSDLVQLRSLVMHGCNMKHVDPLACLNMLQYVDLSFCHELVSIQGLCNLHSLKSLILLRCDKLVGIVTVPRLKQRHVYVEQ